MNHWKAALNETGDLRSTFDVPATYTAGHPIGIIAIDLVYPKLPGNVVNATTYDFPVLYKKVAFEIELLFEGDESIKQQIIDAARELEAEGVRAIIGACGFFAHFQPEVAAAVDVPVYLSSLCQLPMISLGLKEGQKIAVFAASGDNVDEKILEKVGARSDNLIVQDVGGLESFAPIRWGKTKLDNAALTDDLARISADLVAEHPEIAAILLECSDLPPYAYAIQAATGLPVYDFNTLINWVHSSVVRKPYRGYF